MNPRVPDRPLADHLRRQHEAVRRALVARHALRALAVCALALAAGVLAGAWLHGGPVASTARLAVLGAVALLAIGGAVAAVRAQVPRFPAWLEGLEHQLPELRSWLRNALDLEAATDAHTSPELAAAVRAEAGRRLAAAPIDSRRPRVAAAAPLRLAAAALAVMLLAVLIDPRSAQRSWLTLWDPAAAAPPVTLAVQPGSVRISPGATVSILARVRGTAGAPRLLGDGPSPAPALESDERGERRWRFDLPPVTRARHYAVRVRRTESPRYAIELAGEPQPVSFSYELRAPAYARLPAQTGSATRGDLAALAGSTARIEVTFDRDLLTLYASAPGGTRAAWKALTPRRWRGELGIRRDGEWRLHARAQGGEGTFRYRITALPDAPPVVTVARPDGDQDLPSGSRVPFDVLVQDDLGLSDLRLEYRKDAAQPWRGVPLAAFRGEPREARVAAAWDAAALSLLPGESATFRFGVRDNNRVTGPATAWSPEFHLRFPTLAELYDKLDNGHEQVRESLQHVADQAKEVQKSLDQLQRTQPRPGMQSSPAFERSEEMRRALERQKELSRQIDRAAENLHEHAQDAAEREAFRDELQAKLRQMSDVLRQIQSPEFRAALERMQKALEQMDRRGMEQALPQLREENRDLLKNIERSLALLQQLRDEERLESLANRAEELKARQQELNSEHRQAAAKAESEPRNAADRAERQKEAAQQSEKLAQDARESAQQMSDEEARKDLQAAADELQQNAASEQQQAAEETEAGEPQKAGESGEQAAQSLSKAGERMSRSSQSAQRQRAERQLQAVRRAAQDLVSLGQDAARHAPDDASTQQAADRQTDLAEGVARVADSLASLSRETPMLTPKAQQALGQAMQGLMNSGRQISQGNPTAGAQEGGGARAALNQAVNELRAAEGSMGKPSGQGGDNQGGKPSNGQQSGGQESVGQRMTRLGQRQGELNQRSRDLSRRLSEQMRLSAGDQAGMRRLAEEQARIREELNQVQRDDTQHHLLGRLDETRKDMEKVEEQLGSGEPGADLEERQNQILSRMLDAQRSINRRDFDPQREAERGADVSRASAPELPPSLLRERDRLRYDLMRSGADRYPAQYRAFIERYLQRLEENPK